MTREVSNICPASYSLQNPPTYTTSLNTQHSLVSNVHPKGLSNGGFLHADFSFLSLKMKFPTENVLPCLVHMLNLSSFLKTLFKEDIIFAPSSQERGNGQRWSGGKLSKGAQEGRTQPCGPWGRHMERMVDKNSPWQC